MNQKKTLILLFSLLILILGLIGLRFLKKDRSLSSEDWAGTWEVSYYYDNEPALLYEGTVYIEVRDSLSGQREVLAPNSLRPETVPLSNLSFGDKVAIIRGEAIHTRYKIKGGFLQETFELNLTSPRTFTGHGRCTAYCAEGTEKASIIWDGIKTD